MPKVNNFKVILEQDEEGCFVASVPAIPGCFTQGETYEDAIKNIKEVISLCLDEAKENTDYQDKIDYNQNQKDKFIGIAEVSVTV